MDKHGEQRIITLFKEKLSERMVTVDLNLYQKYVTYDNKGNAMLYVKMNKALYGLLQSALLFYKKLMKNIKAYGFVINPYDLCVANDLIESHQIKAYGFVINPYDLCVANDLIESHQMRVTWNVDNLKVSHKDPYQITKFAGYLSIIYDKKLEVKRGKVHDYLGMNLDYSE